VEPQTLNLYVASNEPALDDQTSRSTLLPDAKQQISSGTGLDIQIKLKDLGQINHQIN